jgi:hypothetical protein
MLYAINQPIFQKMYNKSFGLVLEVLKNAEQYI